MVDICSESSPVHIPNRILIDFYGEVFRLYPNLTSIQESLDEDKKRFSCVFTLSGEISPAQEEEMQRGLLDIIQTKVVPILPPGYMTIMNDICIKIPETPDELIVKKFCQELQKTYPDITQIRTTLIGNDVVFDIAGYIAPRVKHAIRQAIIADFPLWEEYQPRDPVFYTGECIPSNAQDVSQGILSRITSLFER